MNINSVAVPVVSVVPGKQELQAEDRRGVGIGTVSSASISVATLLVGGMVFRTVTYRAIGPSEGGVLALVLTFMLTAGTLATLGTTSAIVKFVAARRDPTEGASYILTGALMIGVQCALAIAVLAVMMPRIAEWLHTPQIVELRWGVLLGIVLVAFQLYWERVYNSLLQHNLAAGMNLTNHTIRVLLCLFLVGFGHRSASVGLFSVLIGFLIANLWGLAMVIRLLRRYGARICGTVYAKNLYGLGIYTFGTIVLEQLVYNTGIFLAARFLTTSAVGLYSSATLLAQGVWLLPSALQTITYPVMSHHWSRRNRAGLEFAINVSMRTALVITAPVVFILFYLRTEIIDLLFGDSFEGASTSLAILLVGYTINAVVRPIGASMSVIGRPQLDVVRAAITGSVSIGLCLWLIPVWGLSGAAWAMTITLILSSLLIVAFIWQTSKITFSWRIVAAGAVFSLLALLFAHLPVSSIGGRVSSAVIGGAGLAAAGWLWGLNSADRGFLIGKLRQT